MHNQRSEIAVAEVATFGEKSLPHTSYFHVWPYFSWIPFWMHGEYVDIYPAFPTDSSLLNSCRVQAVSLS